MDNDFISWWRTDLSHREIDKVTDSIRKRRITQGPVTEELEKQIAEFLGHPHVIMTTNGSAALLAALIACETGPGDEVIIPGSTFIATANAPLLLGAKVKVVDVQSDAPLIDPAKIEQAISDRTKVIIPVHLNGRSADMEQINIIAEKHGILVVEDAAQALGSKNRQGHLGTQSHIGCFSMSISKLITTGEGGFCVTKDTEACQKLLQIRNNGAASLSENRFNTLGFNLRQNDILSSMGLAQIPEIYGKMDALKRVYEYYKTNLKGIDYLKMLEVNTEAGELPLWIEVLCAQREKVIRKLAEKGIQAKPFPPAICNSPHVKACDDLPNSKFFASHGMVLPCGPDQPQENLERTVEALQQLKSQIKVDFNIRKR